MAKLNQIIAIEKGVKSRVYVHLSDLHKANQKPALFEGFSKEFVSLEEDGEKLPPDSKRVQIETKNVIREVTRSLSELFDLTARKDWSNCVARGDVVVDGDTLISDVPVPFLLFLEKQLTDVHTLVKNLPVLDFSEDWTLDPNSGLYRTDELKTHRTKKVQKPLVLYPATENHPAQTQMVTEDIISGHWSQVRYSGAIPRTQQETLLVRVEALLKAVKEAREQANAIEEEPTPKVSSLVFGYIFGDVS